MKIPETPPATTDLLEALKKDSPELILKILEYAKPLDSNGKYRHWDKLKYLELPDGIKSHDLWWTLIKLARRNNYKHLKIKGIDEVPFKFMMVDEFLRINLFLDQSASGNIAIENPILNPQLKDYYLVNSLIEEAINSSQLEGATTTRDIAKKMIREGRTPRDKSEHMILNNYKAIKYIQTVKDEKLSPLLIQEIHHIMSKNTLDDEDKSGGYRDENDDIHVIGDNHQIVFTPPKHNEVEQRIVDLCAFANEENEKSFIHPAIKAIILHFLLAYIHPFIDGNGRTARALFYWFMLKKGYWLVEFVSISKILKSSPAQYSLSYLYTETDENDLTYFIDYQLHTLKRAIDELNSYIKRKMKEIESTTHLLKTTKLANKLNIRQLTLLKSALKLPGAIYTIKEYKNTHNIVYQTARKDLLELSDRYELLVKVKNQNSFLFIVPSDLKKRIEDC